MAEQIYYSVFTKKGLELLTEAIRNGTKLGITSMAFGDGGGSLPVPNENFTSMVREVHRTQLNSLAPDPNNANWLRADAIIASATGGFNIRELGLYAGNVLVAYSNYPATYKPNPSDGTARIMSFRMILQIDNTANFDLVIDPDVVLATIQKVEDAKLEIYQNTVNTVQSILDLLKLESLDGRVVNVDSYHAADYSLPIIPAIEGGGQFRYVAALKNINDGGICINGWLRLKATYNYLTPEMFGAKGIGAAYDDQVPIQNMLNAGAQGCTFDFDGAKTYYNAFKIDDSTKYIDHYNAANNSRQWIRKLGATFNFNGCKFLRRTPTGDIEDVPFKTKYSDNDSSLLLIKGAENIYFNNGNFDSNATLGTLVDINNNEIEETKNLYYTAKVGTHGIRLNNCNNVFFSNTIVEKAYFNIFIDGSTNVFGNVITNYSVQCPIRTYSPNDMNLGAGLKVWFSRNVKMNVTGKYNANATAEIEKFNYDVEINGGSEYDYSNGMVIQSTKGVRFDWTSKKVKGGTALLIMDANTGADDDYCSDIKGKLTSYDVAWCGLSITMSESCTQDFYGIEIDVLSENSAYAGLYISNKNQNKSIKGCNINHWSHNDNGTMKSRLFEGRMTGTIKGGSSNTDYGLFVRGTNTKETCLRFELDLRECAVPWVIDSTSFAEFNNTVTSTNAFFIAANVTQNFGSADAGMSYISKGEIRFNQNVLHNKAAYSVFDNLNTAHGSEKFRLYYDTTAANAVSGGNTYPIKVFVPSNS